MRGSRLDPARACKVNHAFVFADCDDCHGVLQLLKKADPSFSTRIRVIGSRYDAVLRSPRTVEVMAAVRDQETFLRRHADHLDVECISLEKNNLFRIKGIPTAHLTMIYFFNSKK
jgi:hypothetical protein